VQVLRVEITVVHGETMLPILLRSVQLLFSRVSSTPTGRTRYRHRCFTATAPYPLLTPLGSGASVRFTASCDGLNGLPWCVSRWQSWVISPQPSKRFHIKPPVVRLPQPLINQPLAKRKSFPFCALRG
jgi:hypothetical protein